MYIAQNAAIQNMIRYTHDNMLLQGPDQAWVLPPSLWGMKVVVMMSVQNTANIAQTESLSDIWDDTIILAYIAPSPGLKRITWGYTIQSRPWQTKKWREEARSASLVEVSTIRDLKIISTGCAYKITDTLAAAYE